MKHLINLTLLLLLTASADTFAQRKIYIDLFDSPEQEVLISNLSKITFSTGNMVLRFFDNTETTFSINTVKRIAFVPYGSTEVTNVDESVGLALYPNPARDYIMIQNLPSTPVSVSVYSLQGALLKTQLLSSENETIDLSLFNPGMYFLKTADTVIKFTKL